MSVAGVLRQLLRKPGELLVRRWNWKSAVCSSLIRALIFFVSNLTAGWRAATGAMLAEFVFRAITAGFYGALTQAFRGAEPAWLGALTVALLLPLASHSLEWSLHVLRGTPRLLTSIVASIFFTVISTLFNLYAMRRGALVVGDHSASLGSDLRRMPLLIGGFLACGPAAVWRWLSSLGNAAAVGRPELPG